MAFNYQTGISLVYASLPSEDQAKINQHAVGEILKFQKEQKIVSPYKLNDYRRKKLDEAGVPLMINPILTHTHPVCKTIENHILYNVLPSYVDDSFKLIGIKQGKVNLFSSRLPGKAIFLDVLNRFISSKDLLRYGRDSSFNVREADRCIGDLDEAVVSTLLPENVIKTKKKKRKFFLHDELHYWSPLTLSKFLDAAEPEVVIATHVYPKELLKGVNRSMNPWCYDFEVDGDSLSFFPDGVKREAYFQPLQGDFLLRCNRFVTYHGTVYNVDVLYTCYAHCLLSITRSDLVCDTYRYFDQFTGADLSGLCALDGSLSRDDYLELDKFLDLLKYFMTLKKPDDQSLQAKLRAYSDDSSAMEMQFYSEFSKLYIAHGVGPSVITREFWADALAKLGALVPASISKLLGLFMRRTLSDVLSRLKTFEVKIECRTFEASSRAYTSEAVQSICGRRDRVIRKKKPNVYNIIADIIGLSAKSNTPEVPSEFAKEYIYDFPGQRAKRIAAHRSTRAVDSDISLWFYYEIIVGFASNKPITTAGAEAFNAANGLVILICPFDDENILEDFLVFTGLSAEGYDVLREQFLGGFSRIGHRFIEDSKAPPFSEGEIANAFEHLLLAVAGKPVRSPRARRNSNSKAPSGEASEAPLPPPDNPEEQANDIAAEPVLFNFGEIAEEIFNMMEEEDLPAPISEASVPAYTKYSFLPGSDLDRFFRVNVPGDGNCFFHALSRTLDLSAEFIKEVICNSSHSSFDDPTNSAIEQSQILILANDFAEEVSCIAVSAIFGCTIHIHVDHGTHIYTNDFATMEAHLYLADEHYERLRIKNGCVIRALSEALEVEESRIAGVLKNADPILYEEAMGGSGVEITTLEQIFAACGVTGLMDLAGDHQVLNPGFREFPFRIIDNHLSFIIRPVSPNSRLRYFDDETSISSGDLSFLLQSASCIDLKPSVDRAKLLESSLLSGDTGKISDKLFNGKDQSDLPAEAYKGRKAFVAMGTYGSGKSRNFINFCSNRKDKRILIISPRSRLKEDIQKKIGVTGKFQKGVKLIVETFEVALKFLNKQWQLVIIDEVQLFPPGYLDFICGFIGGETPLYLTGDPAQALYDSERDRMAFIDQTNDVLYHLDSKEYNYNNTSRRFKSSLFQNRLMASMPGAVDDSQFYLKVFSKNEIRKHAKQVRTCLTSSFAEKNFYKHFLELNQEEVLTFGQSTGLTFEKVIIVISKESLKTDHRRWNVALSRASTNIIFYFEDGMTVDMAINSDQTSPLALFFAARASSAQLMNYLPGKPTISDGFRRIGKDFVDREERLEGDHYLKTMIFLGQRANPEEPEVQESVMPQSYMKTHLPVEGLNNYLAVIQPLIRDKMRREKRIRNDMSNQFTDREEARNFMLMTNQMEKVEALFPRHRSDDGVTFLMAVRKRLSFCEPSKNFSDFKSKWRHGYEMADRFEKFIPIFGNFDVKLYEECVNDFECKKLEKSKATIANHRDRSCPDWPIDKVRIFMKNQLTTKIGNRGVDAKAGQTLACFSHLVLVRLAPYVRYMEKRLLSRMPKNFYIHSGKNFDELNDYVQKNGFCGECTENDYTAFDASQDATILAFEVEIMRRMQLPVELIEDYTILKCTTYSKLGHMSIMRFTGEAATFLFNTMASMVFTLMAFDVKKEVILFAGDDMCANQPLKKWSKFDHILKGLKLKAKLEYTSKPSFCGWMLTGEGIYKHPKLLLERFLIAKELGNVPNCIDNYALEASYAYKRGDVFVKYLDDEELMAHHLLVRFLITSRNLMQSQIKDIFANGQR